MSGLQTMLLRAGVVTPEQAKDARGHQVVFGDRIGTNLLALGFLSEATLAQALGTLHNTAWAAGLTADSKPALTRTLPRAIAARLSAVPAVVDADGVTVFMIDPTNAAALAELAAHYKRPVRPVVVCEGRMWALLNKFYLVRRGMRALKLDGPELRRTALVSKAVERRATSGEGAPMPAAPAPARAPPPTSPPPPRPAPAPAARTSLVDLLLPAPSRPAVEAPSFGQVGAPQTAIPVAAASDVDAGGEDAPWLVPVAAPPEAVEVRPPSRSFLGAAAFAEAEVPLEDLEAMLGDASGADNALVLDAIADDATLHNDEDAADDPARRAPLSFDEAKAQLATVKDRNEIARLVLRAARTRARRAVLLTVQGAREPVALGWDALGDGMTAHIVHELRLSLSEPSVLQLAHTTRGHVLGPVAKGAVNDELYRLLGGAPRSAFVAPILAGGRVVNLLYLDDGPGRFMPPDIGEVLILCQHINKSYDTLLARAR